MFKRWYKVTIYVTPKVGARYTITKRDRMTKKQMVKLVNTRQCGIGDVSKGYKWIGYGAELI